METMTLLFSFLALAAILGNLFYSNRATRLINKFPEGISLVEFYNEISNKTFKQGGFAIASFVLQFIVLILYCLS